MKTNHLYFPFKKLEDTGLDFLPHAFTNVNFSYYWQEVSTITKYVKERNCLGDKFLRFSRIFAKFAKLNPREKSTGSQFAKLNLRETYIFTLGSLSINDGHVENILQDIKEYK